MSNGKTFKAQLGKWAQQTQEKLDALVRQSSQEVAARVVESTPVDTGFLRGSWQPSIGEMSSRPADGSSNLSAISLAIAGMKAGDTFYMINNTEYGPSVEFGTSKRAGRFFVLDNVKRWPVIVEQVAHELKMKS